MQGTPHDHSNVPLGVPEDKIGFPSSLQHGFLSYVEPRLSQTKTRFPGICFLFSVIYYCPSLNPLSQIPRYLAQCDLLLPFSLPFKARLRV